MKLTDALLGEHAVLYDLFTHLRALGQKDGGIEEMRGAFNVLDQLLRSHAGIEEELLFPNLEPHIGQMGPLAVMKGEHKAIDDLLDALATETDIAALKSLTNELIDLAFSHFQKEEGALFPMARQFLDEAKLSELGDLWAQKRKVNANAQGCMGGG
ncbi:MAG: hemerythrin domain-containing protein [Rhodospirillaceae bacterium]|jgi:iron-sulfur cluster repair protein YtfE (RIC family)|nr:hemerythrin domain-containing protein [Rhodospirillaceae bacterium]MBT5660103.1 hemerythrin domain-containing protein [Rhodospirillaceae bacterium]MBT5751946.1 hemerythrin domain-containing protein [Rhodospirillaceae bacterium]